MGRQTPAKDAGIEKMGGRQIGGVDSKARSDRADQLQIFRSEVYALYSHGNNEPFGRRTTLFKGKLPDVSAVISREYKDRFGKMLVTGKAET